ncbi:ABC transporter substrate-binding protein [Prosthecomicrobium sp. N25]|uniref:ABC transporter substrate-binding protein n=1 Tax=Prosthecomicrobium sp. N25 TaxID=3129254 RepID=UPI0030786A72
MTIGIAKSVLAGAVALALGTGAAWAQAKDVKFTLDWAVQGNHAIWTVAQERGYFTKEGLNVKIDRGFGSGDAVTKVASGAYDIGFSDINAVIKYNGENPTNPVIGVFQTFDKTLNSIITLKKSGIKSPKDLVGKNLGSPEADSSRLMFPAFAKANGLDPAAVKWTSMQPQLREAMLVQGQVDAISGFASTSVFNLTGVGVAEADIVVFSFPDNGLDLYGSTVIVRKEFAEKNPDTVAAFVRATVAGLKDVAKDPDGVIPTLAKVDPLVKQDLEKARLKFVLDRAMLTPGIKANGFGHVDPARMLKSIEVAAEAYALKAVPKPEDVYSTKFLPPADQRKP